jgi:3-phenylpropionate/trans-cinnamate dioxygenase ferredoxin reductase subunit
LEDGSRQHYGALLIATGADPVRLEVPATICRISITCAAWPTAGRSLKATTSRWAVVIGASFIGLEVASSLRARGLKVHVMAP